MWGDSPHTPHGCTRLSPGMVGAIRRSLAPQRPSTDKRELTTDHCLPTSDSTDNREPTTDNCDYSNWTERLDSPNQKPSTVDSPTLPASVLAPRLTNNGAKCSVRG